MVNQPKHPTIDVIILSWNRIQMTLETIENILEQQNVSPHIWIIDQGSEPNNLKHLKDSVQDYPNVHIKALKENVGVPGGRNLGMEMGSADYTVSIDNDAIFESPQALAQVVERFEQAPNMGAISFRIMNFYTEQDDELSWVYPKALKQQRDQSFITTRFCGCGHAIRRSAFERAEGYDADLFFFWEETDLCYRLINVGYEIVYDPSIIVRHKCSPEARVRWEDQRFYYLVRNAIYLYLKYNPNSVKVAVPALGYLVKGSYNGLLADALKGIFDGLKMYRRLSPQLAQCKDILEFTPETKAYLQKHEFQYRGSFLNRIRTEILTALPGYETMENPESLNSSS